MKGPNPVLCCLTVLNGFGFLGEYLSSLLTSFEPINVFEKRACMYVPAAEASWMPMPTAVLLMMHITSYILKYLYNFTSTLLT